MSKSQIVPFQFYNNDAVILFHYANVRKDTSEYVERVNHAHFKAQFGIKSQFLSKVKHTNHWPIVAANCTITQSYKSEATLSVVPEIDKSIHSLPMTHKKKDEILIACKLSITFFFLSICQSTRASKFIFHWLQANASRDLIRRCKVQPSNCIIS